MESKRRTALAAASALFLLGGVNASRADTYTVTNTNSSGAGSLAQAILDANARSGQDTVVFNIPGSGVQLIDLSKTFLPDITDSLILDGYTQPGAHPNTLSVGNNAVILIQLDGAFSFRVPGNGCGLLFWQFHCIGRPWDFISSKRQWQRNSRQFHWSNSGRRHGEEKPNRHRDWSRRCPSDNRRS